MHQHQIIRTIQQQAINSFDEVEPLAGEGSLGPERGERAHAKHRRYRGLEDAGQPLNGLTIHQILNGGMPVHLVGQGEVVFQGSHLVHPPRQPRQRRACGTAHPRNVVIDQRFNRGQRRRDLQPGQALNQHTPVLRRVLQQRSHALMQGW